MSTGTTVYCANHPKVETAVSCSDCGKPICPDCMVPAAVGIKCRECARMPRSARAGLRPQKAARAVAGSAAAGTGLGVLLAYAGYAGFGFFTIIVAFLVGYLVGRATVRAGGYYRGETTGWIAAGGAAWAYVLAAIVIASQVGGSPRLYVQVLGLLVAGFIAYREAT
ncbi:MAG: B-box zinc finger protein [Gaiellales bacterium]